MKKVSIFLVISALFAALSIATFAAGTPTFVVSSATAEPNDTVNVTINIKNNPGIASAKLVVTYDSALTLESVTYGKNLGGMTQQPYKLTSPVILNWISAFTNLTTDEIYATLVFRVSSSATAGKHTVSVTYDEDDVYNLNENNVYFAVENGCVTVIHANEPTTEQTTAATTGATTVISTTEVTTVKSTEPTMVSSETTAKPIFTYATNSTASTAATTEATVVTAVPTTEANTTTEETTIGTTVATTETITQTPSTAETVPISTTAEVISTVASEETKYATDEVTTLTEVTSCDVIVAPPEAEKPNVTVPLIIVGTVATLAIAAFVVYFIKYYKYK